MNVLGISCHYHDSAACMVRNGIVVAAAQEERFTREKHTGIFPKHAVNFCVQRAGISFGQVDLVVFYEKPYLKFSRALQDHLLSFPFSFPAFLRSMPDWLGDRLHIPITVKSELGIEAPVYFVKHHLSHAAGAYFTSPFQDAAVLTVDGVGEWATATLGYGNGRRLIVQEELRYPHSLGLFYGAVTSYLGFSANGGEGKTMGLAAFGDPERFRQKMSEVVRVDFDGNFDLDLSYFSFRRGSGMWARKFEAKFGAARTLGGEFTQHHKDVAAAAQACLEGALLAMARRAKTLYPSRNLCLSGGVALNCVANQKLLESGIFEKIFVQPAAGDAGGAVGAALYGHFALSGLNGDNKPIYGGAEAVFLGPDYTQKEIEREIKRFGFKYQYFPDENDLATAVGERLAEGAVVGWFQGRMEFGPRALGSRSILADPRSGKMKDHLNLKVKRREAFRPFAPVVKQEVAGRYFIGLAESPYMLFSHSVRPEFRKQLPAITHVDGSARVQTVTEDQNSLLYRLLGAFERITGFPILLNTSFNLDGEPIVCEPAHALACFESSAITDLAIGPYLISKDNYKNGV